MLTHALQRRQIEDALTQASRDSALACSALLTGLPIIYGCSSADLEVSAAARLRVTEAGSRIDEARRRLEEFDVADGAADPSGEDGRQGQP